MHRFAVLSVCLLTAQLPGATPAGAESQKEKKPEVWMAVLPADVLVQEGAQWDFVRKHVDGVKFWTQQIDDEARLWPFQGGVDTPDALKKLIAVLKVGKIPLIIEKGMWPPATPRPDIERMGGEHGPYDDTYHVRAVKNEMDRIRRVEALGGRVRFFDVDGPIRHMIHPVLSGPGFPTIERAAQEFTRYMLGIHRERPQIEFFALTNFPNWGYRGDISYWGNAGWGDYFTALEAIIRNAQRAGAPLRGITVDNPYDYAIGEVRPPVAYDSKKMDWIARILDIERYVHQHHLEFNLICNSQRGGETSADLFCKETLDFIDLYRKRGGRPDRYIIQSWYTHPTRAEIVPENKPGTFTWLVKEVIRRVKGVPEPAARR
jgi:hypothetical protein